MIFCDYLEIDRTSLKFIRKVNLLKQFFLFLLFILLVKSVVVDVLRLLYWEINRTSLKFICKV